MIRSAKRAFSVTVPPAEPSPFTENGFGNPSFLSSFASGKGTIMKRNTETFAHGAVLKVEREHSRAELRAMLQAMHDAGLRTVVVWPAVYWWEPQSDHYPYQTGRCLLEDAEEIGMQVIMELAGQITALEYAPDFRMEEDYFCIDRKGNYDEGGLGYGYLNFNHPRVKDLICRQYREIAREYRDFPALKGYDLWNETQFTSFDRYTLELFRNWLQEKYGDLSRLNDSWDRAYQNWEEIRFTQWMWASVMAFVDYQEFHKDNIGRILRYMREAVESADCTHEIYADNIHASVTMDRYYDRPTDDWTVAREVDRYGISFYPKFLSKNTPPFLRHQTMTGAASAATDGRFAISEMQTHHATMFNPEGSVSPQELWQWCWEAVSHGADGIIYWKWNPFRKGVQTFGRGLVDPQGRETPRLEAVRRFGEVIDREPELMKCRPVKPAAAILYNRLNLDFTKAYTIGFQGVIGAPSSIYLDSLAGLYRTLWEHNIPVRFITPEQFCRGDADDIPMLFMTTQTVMDRNLSDKLLSYTEQGGVCICDGKLGEVNETGLLYSQIPGCGLSEKLGFELLDMEEGDLEFTLSDGSVVQGGHDRRQMRIFDPRVTTIASYRDGSPAAVSIPYGKGTFCYLSTFLWFACKKQSQPGAYTLIEALFGGNLPAAAVCDHRQVNLQRLSGKNADYLFAFNYGVDCKISISIPDTKEPVIDVLDQTSSGTSDSWTADLRKGAVGIYRIAHNDSLV